MLGKVKVGRVEGSVQRANCLYKSRTGDRHSHGLRTMIKSADTVSRARVAGSGQNKWKRGHVHAGKTDSPKEGVVVLRIPVTATATVMCSGNRPDRWRLVRGGGY